MTFEDFILAQDYRTSEQRIGQYAFNILSAARPDISEQVRSVLDLDPFYCDANMRPFLKFVRDAW